MAESLILIRHGTVAEGYRGRYVGRTDVPLSPAGEAQAQALAGRFGPWQGADVLVSPLQRCRQTAALALGSGAAFRIDPDLREIDFGRWEGLTFAEIAAREPALVECWAAFAEDFAFPEGEAVAAFRQRVAAAAARIAGSRAKRAVVVAHGGVIRFLICHFLGLSPRDHLLFAVAPASVSELRIKGERGSLTLLNDRHHLEGS